MLQAGAGREPRDGPVLSNARIAPVEGQGRLRQPTTRASHNCTFYPSLDTWVFLACVSYGSDVFKQLAQPCSGVPNQAGRDNLSLVDRGFMLGFSRAAREFMQDA